MRGGSEYGSVRGIGRRHSHRQYGQVGGHRGYWSEAYAGVGGLEKPTRGTAGKYRLINRKVWRHGNRIDGRARLAGSGFTNGRQSRGGPVLASIHGDK